MAKKQEHNRPLPFPLQAGIALGIMGGLLSGFSFWVIQYWPLPASVTPIYNFNVGFGWGAVVGFSFGIILGFMCDDSHFPLSDEHLL